MDEGKRNLLLRLGALILVVGISLLVFSLRDKAEQLAVFGYPGIFLIALMANATILLPAPGVAVVFAMGAVFHPLGVALAAGAGGALGELTGYLAGFSGRAVIEQAHVYAKLLPWVQRFGPFAVLVLAAIPNPFFDVVGIAAGILKMPLWQFLVFTWIGQTIKMLIFAFAGAYSINKFFK